MLFLNGLSKPGPASVIRTAALKDGEVWRRVTNLANRPVDLW
jgi:hypothetical protein